MKLSLVVFCISVCAIPVQAQNSIDSLSWLAGHWMYEGSSKKQEEYWMAPSGGMMLGLHRDVSANGKTFFEYLRIVERDGALHFHASPGGKVETVFIADSLAPGFVRFINPTHDYPQRIQYARDSDGMLRASISDAEGGKVRSWRFRPVE
ncbi:MAG: DUF6265 family protein [Bacteroidia bacterium]|nr:DUF6265 family protein [Bacteroidia bacterium]